MHWHPDRSHVLLGATTRLTARETAAGGMGIHVAWKVNPVPLPFPAFLGFFHGRPLRWAIERPRPATSA